MKLVKFMNEGMVEVTQDIEHRDIMDILNRDCKEMLLFIERKKVWFSRYYKGKFKGLRKVIPRSDRQPMDTPLYIHNIVDAMFNGKFGWKVRSEGVFTWPQDRFALEQDPRGDAFFPIGKLQAVFDKTNKIDDLYLWLQSSVLMFKFDHPNFSWNLRTMENIPKDNIEDQELKNKYLDYLRTELMKHYTSDISKIGRASKSEIVWKCPAYYLLYVDQFRDMVREGYIKL